MSAKAKTFRDAADRVDALTADVDRLTRELAAVTQERDNAIQKLETAIALKEEGGFLFKR
jgi:ABC-type transporter Mla subunit MlaD